MHGQEIGVAWPCHPKTAWHGRVWWHGLAVPPCWDCNIVVLSCSMAVWSSVCLRSAFLSIRSFFIPLFLLKLTRKAFLSIKTQGLLLKNRQNTL